MDKLDLFYNKHILSNYNFKYIKIWLFFLSIIILIIINVFIFYEYHNYVTYMGSIQNQDNNFYIKLYIEEEDIINFPKSVLYFNDDKQNYDVIKISENYYLNENYKKMYEVFIKTNIDDVFLIENNIVRVNKQLPKTTIFKQITKKIKKGLKT